MDYQNLDELRTQIDEIDREMVALFEKRMTVAREIGTVKANAGRPVRDKAREEERIAAGIAALSDKSYAAAYRSFQKRVMALSRAEQKRVGKGDRS